MTSPTPWRVGRHVGRTVYDANEYLIGVMDTREDAFLVVTAVNAVAAQPPPMRTEPKPQEG